MDWIYPEPVEAATTNVHLPSNVADKPSTPPLVTLTQALPVEYTHILWGAKNAVFSMTPWHVRQSPRWWW